MLLMYVKQKVMNRYKVFFILALVLIYSACTNVWEEHTKVNADVLQENIYSYLESNADYSQFVEMLKSTGYDVFLNSSSIFTVWAPTNEQISKVDQALINTDDKLKLFVTNHFTNGMYSTLSNSMPESIQMKSGKILSYDKTNKLLDGVAINTDTEVTLMNGVIQSVNSAIIPRYSIWDYIQLEAPQNKFVTFMQSLTKSVFDLANSPQLGVNEMNMPVYDSIWIEVNKFFIEVADLSSEDSVLTFLIPSDEVFDAEFEKFQKYYRKDDKISNTVPTSRDSAYIGLMIARDMVFESAYSASEAPDILISYFGVKVPFNKTSVTKSYQASNGYVHQLSDCSVKPQDKILPILMEAEQCLTYWTISNAGGIITNTTSGTGTPYMREHKDASGGYDLIVDNSDKSAVLSGALFAGPRVASIKYRIKIRAINDFRKSYRYPDSEIPLKQWLGQVTITRNPITEEVVAISPATNAFNSGTEFGIPDVTYDSSDPSTYYVSYDSTAYSPIANALDDEIDLGYYNFAKADNVVLRLIPESNQMAVTADYFRLVPIFE